MAVLKNKFSQNLEGKYYVDDQCIACDACVVEAPQFFAMNDVEGHAYVFKQPTKLEDIESCQNALVACPVEAIGDDGESKT